MARIAKGFSQEWHIITLSTQREIEIMFGLSEAHFNAVKRQAAKLNDEYSKLSPKQRKDDKQVAALISKMWEPVFTIISRDRFCWVAGYIKGRVGHDENGQSLYE